MSVEIACCIRLKDPVARHHLISLAQHESVSKIWVVRHDKIGLDDIPKVEYILVPARVQLLRFILMILACIRIGKKKEVKAFVSFNPLPYGLFGWIGARFNKKPIHFGFIGLDWNYYIKRSWGELFLPIFRQGDLVTVPGETFRQEMLAHGFDSDKVLVMPHSTDIERFEVSDIEKTHSCIYVGELIPLKRVDIILKAFAKILKTRSGERLYIVGDGPERTCLELLAEELGITANVDFTGHADNVQPLIASSRIIIIASQSEGFPSALVEGMCCGLVPVCTAVGAIPDCIINGKNGLLFANGNIEGLAGCIKLLLDDSVFYNRLRDNVIAQRMRFSHDAITPLWDNWLTKIDSTE